MKYILPLVLSVGACATPSHEYFGVPAQSVLRDGREYRVHVRREGNLAHAQVIRMGWAGGRDHIPIMAAMVAAAEAASGCQAAPGAGQGDSGVLNLRLRCD